MNFDLGNFADQVAQQFGFEDVGDAATTIAIQETKGQIQRLVEKPGQDVKQTPPVVQPTAYVQEMLAQMPFELKLTQGQALAVGGIGLALVVYLVVRR